MYALPSQGLLQRRQAHRAAWSPREYDQVDVRPAGRLPESKPSPDEPAVRSDLPGPAKGPMSCPLFPECLEDWICEDNPVRAVDVFVDELDLSELGFGGVDPKATGRPSYHPSILLKPYIYGYLNRVQSSRRLEREAGRNVEVMWLTGRLAPDHKTIADFRKDNGTAICKVCAQFVALCRELGLLTRCH
jgi:transposase